MAIRFEQRRLVKEVTSATRASKREMVGAKSASNGRRAHNTDKEVASAEAKDGTNTRSSCCAVRPRQKEIKRSILTTPDSMI